MSLLIEGASPRLPRRLSYALTAVGLAAGPPIGLLAVRLASAGGTDLAG
jgi:hypothetical protein